MPKKRTALALAAASAATMMALAACSGQPAGPSADAEPVKGGTIEYGHQ